MTHSPTRYERKDAGGSGRVADGDRAGDAGAPEPVPVSALSGAHPSRGQVFDIAYPFVRDTYSGFDGEGYADIPSWRPGVRFESYGPEDVVSIADAIGRAIFTVVDVFKPGRFPVRVFFTRQFVSPEGATFGKGKLHIVTLDKFRRLVRGYQHPFGIGEPLKANPYNRAAVQREFLALLAAHNPSPRTSTGGEG